MVCKICKYFWKEILMLTNAAFIWSKYSSFKSYWPQTHTSITDQTTALVKPGSTQQNEALDLILIFGLVLAHEEWERSTSTSVRTVTDSPLSLQDTDHCHTLTYKSHTDTHRKKEEMISFRWQDKRRCGWKSGTTESRIKEKEATNSNRMSHYTNLYAERSLFKPV